MRFEQAEYRLQELRAQRETGSLDEDAFRTEVAKLTLLDESGTVWMLEAETGAWVCNRGTGWISENPGETAVVHRPQLAQPPHHLKGRRRVARWLALGVVLVLLLGIASVVAWRLGLLEAWGLWPGGQGQERYARVTIASPPDGSQVHVDHAVPVESVIEGIPDLQVVDHVELHVDGQRVSSQTIRTTLQPDQTLLPLSPSWYPDKAGEYKVSVLAFAADGSILGEASLTLHVTEATDKPLPETACSPDAAFVRDVNIPPGTAFPPGVPREKVWQVRNNGSCAWGEGYRLVLRDGQPLSSPERVDVVPTAAGGLAELRLSFQVPGEPGIYSSTWQLRAPDGQFFGPTLTLSITVEAQVEENPPPIGPNGLEAEVSADGQMVLLTWQDRSDNEDGFRIYREDIEASIALTRADVEEYRDEEVTCGNTYRYSVVAFNASGPSESSQSATAVLPSCAPAVTPAVTTTSTPLPALIPTLQPLPTATILPSPTATALPLLMDHPPSLTITVSPTVILTSGVFTITFLAGDDRGVERVLLWGVETGISALDRGRIFTCTAAICTGSWTITWTREVSASWTLVALAVDSSAQQSGLARALVTVVLPEQEP